MQNIDFPRGQTLSANPNQNTISMKFIAIIPARYASTRFPGKPLAMIHNKTMIQRVYEQSLKVLPVVYVATDDERIKKTVRKFQGNVVMTSEKHQSGTDRVKEAYEKIQQSKEIPCDVIINIQGDEPFIHPGQIEELMSCFKHEATEIATLVKPVNNKSELFNPNIPKVITNHHNQAIYFSRTAIPFIRNKESQEWLKHFTFLKHIGMYAYRTHILKEITALDPSSLELAESLEQNRWIENDYKIMTARSKYDNYPIDTPEDLEKLRNNLP